MNTKNHTEVNIGIDVSQSHLDMHVRPLEQDRSFTNDADGIKESIKFIKQFKPSRVLIEATGRLELDFVIAATKARLPVVVCNPVRMRKFAGSIGRLAKTDQLDAHDIAFYGESTKPALTTLRPEKLRLVSDLLAVRSQLLDLATMQKNRLGRMPKAVHRHLDNPLKAIKAELVRVEKRLDKLIESLPELNAKVELLMSAKGVGKVLAYTLISELPELGKIDRREVAAIVGVAPMNKDSGSYRGKRSIRGGRHKIRTVLFVSMMSAIQCHPKLRPMYQRMVAAGKPKKVALVACMRKQLIILNSMMKTGTFWDEKMV